MNDCWRLRAFANTPEKEKSDKGLGPLTPGFHPNAVAFFKRERGKDSGCNSPGHPEPDIVVSDVRSEAEFVVAAIRRAHVPREVVPGAAANDAGCTGARCIRTAVGRRTAVAVHVAVPDPVRDIAEHVIQPPRVGLERSDRRRPNVTI